MAWFTGKVSLGNFPDLAGAVNKLSESVKNIEKNFDSALGFEDKSDSAEGVFRLCGLASGIWPSGTDRRTLFNPVMAFMGHNSEEITAKTLEEPESLANPDSLKHQSSEGKKEVESAVDDVSEQSVPAEEGKQGVQVKKDQLHPEIAEVIEINNNDTQIETEEAKKVNEDDTHQGSVGDKDSVNLEDKESVISEPSRGEADSQFSPVKSNEPPLESSEAMASSDFIKQDESTEGVSPENLQSGEAKSETDEVIQEENISVAPDEFQAMDLHHNTDEESKETEETADKVHTEEVEESNDTEEVKESNDSQVVMESEPSNSSPVSTRETESTAETLQTDMTNAVQFSEALTSESVPTETDAVVEAVEVIQKNIDFEGENKDSYLSSGNMESDSALVELEKLKKEMKMMESALQGAARQAQAKADEIAKLMNENEHLKSVIEDLRRKSNESEIESLREEYHQRVAALERKVYALTKERDTLRREQSKKSDAAALLKEKDEIINQVMAEGEELSKKQAAQEAQIRKLRAQIRELEEEKKGLTTKLQVEENKVESIRKDKAATEKLLQETIEKHHAELATQKEYYTNALNAAKEAEALAEAQANTEARTELESRLKEAEERETMLVQDLEELRQTLTRKEQQAVYREDRLRRDIEDLQNRYRESERRCEELVTQVPESTRPLLRQIEAMQETTSRRAEAWAAVERSLNSRLQEAEAKAASAEERERSVNERLSQTLSRINVLEAQISCLRAEQTQLSRSLEKERQRAAENRQEYLAAKEEADTHQGRTNQLEEEIRELRKKHKQDLQEALAQRELLQQELEREKTARLDLERMSRMQSSVVSEQLPTARHSSPFENGKLTRKLSSASSLGSVEESFFLQASLDSSDTYSERRNPGEPPMSPYYLKGVTPSVLEATLRQKEGEISSYISRLTSMESIRDSLAEELVQMTAQCEKLRAEAAMLPGIRAELDALRRRHSAALELMGERDEELEELRADIVDLKEMYREQVNLLVNKIQVMSSSIGAA
ncbi:TATA element modulatory factor 1, TATA binding [Dillenia turbinata]|uniref:TATA element modulatory factor 1, TATA binding n=1 Tax=Dillenia turbinata TaxID=194707 RepID=A0AAN8UK19_9MAGN